ncbi:MAG: hypothetical protein GY856_23955 [bacterium]|nr:hypothetical protein [bacterium]
MQRHTHPRSAVWLAALLVLMAWPASAQVIEAGSDLWNTPADGGGTHANFAVDPIPRGFFCPGSAPFTDSLPLHGVPLVTEPAGVLADTDTVVERLSDVYDGWGSTQVIVRALQLRSSQPIEIICPRTGETTFWTATACLKGAQVAGEMDIYQEFENGGGFDAYLPVTVKLKFIQVFPDDGSFLDPTVEGPEPVPVDDVEGVGSGTLKTPSGPITPSDPPVALPLNQTLTQSLMLSASGGLWAFQPVPNSVTHTGGFLVDANCDGIPETWVAGTSNFAGGWNPFAGGMAPIQHQAPQHQHTVMPPLPSDCSCI